MITAPQGFAEACAATGNRVSARILKDGAAVAGDLLRVEQHKGACGQTPEPGTVYASYMTATFNQLEDSLQDSEVAVERGVEISGAIEYIQTGKYTVKKVETSADRVEVTGVGAIGANGGETYTSALSYPAQITDVLGEIASQLGASVRYVGVTPSGEINLSMSGETLRDALGYAAGLLGGFATEGADGSITVAAYKGGEELAFEVGDRMIDSPEVRDPFSITGLTVHVSDGFNNAAGTSYTEGTDALEVNNPYMTLALFDACADNIVGLSYDPAIADISLGDPRLEPWDYVTLTELDGTTRTVPCLTVTHTYSGGIYTKISAPGDEVEDTLSIGALAKGVLDQARIIYSLLTLEVSTEFSGESVVMEAHLLNGSDDVTQKYDPGQFSWRARSEQGERYLGTGYSLTALSEDMGYGTTILCQFVQSTDVILTDRDGNPLTTRTGDVFAIGVPELTLSREVNLYRSDAIQDALTSKVGTESIIASINQSQEEITIQAERLGITARDFRVLADILTWDSLYSQMTEDGHLYVQRLTATDQISLSGGTGSAIVIPFSYEVLSGVTASGTVTINSDGFSVEENYTSGGTAFRRATYLQNGQLHYEATGGTNNYSSGFGYSGGAITEEVVSSGAQYTTTLDPGQVAAQYSLGNTLRGSVLGNNGITTTGYLTVSGTKNRRVETDQYGSRLLYSYETASPLFGDVGEGVIGEDGLCYVPIEPVMAQTISGKYQVFLQAYGEGTIYVKERRGGYFVVAGAPGVEFGWEVKAKQADYDQLRLETAPDDVDITNLVDYGGEAAQHITQLREGKEAA